MQVEPSNDKIRLLVFFNSPVMVNYFGQLITTDEYSCCLISNTDDVPTLFKQFKPDIVLIDDFTSDRKGIVLCNEVNEIMQNSAIPVVLYTHQNLVQDSFSGLLKVLEQPVNVNTFIDQIDEVAIQFVIKDENIAFDY